MKGSFCLNNDKEGEDIVFTLPKNADLEDVNKLFTQFLRSMGYNLPGFISLIYYDDLK